MMVVDFERPTADAAALTSLYSSCLRGGERGVALQPTRNV
jgi:hypothetical protein